MVQLQRLVIFEGLDRCGKSSLRAAFVKHTVECHVTLDRFVTSCRVYDLFFNRSYGTQFYDKLEQIVSDYSLVVFIDTAPSVCLARGAQYTLEELETQRRLFLQNLPPRTIYLWKAENNTVNQLLVKLMECIDALV